MAGWSIDGAPVQIALGHEEILEIPGLLDPDVLKVAHNAQFERVCLGVLVDSLRDPGQWLCTQALSAEYGYPVSLGAAAKALGVTEKDDAGKKLIKLFCLPNRDGSWNTAETHPMDWLDFIAYCEQDVETMIEVHRKLGDWPTDTERKVWIADQRINDQGMRIDIELCRLAAWAVAENKDTDKEEFTKLTEVDNPGSVQQVMAWAAEQGLDLPNLRAETIQAAIDDPATDPAHVRVLELRQDLALAAGGKFSAALDVVSPDDRIRGGLRFFGAHTGRWSGQRVQPQNLPRATVDDPEAAILDLKMGLGADPHTLKALVRSMFIGPLTVVDYASIEARVVAWLANEEWALEAFRDGRDIYVETANRMSTPSTQLTRFQGKVACIAAGSKVLTDQGIVVIEEVTTEHRVWDGESWVCHEGLIYRGKRRVISYGGLTATPDHLVWVEGQEGPIRLDLATASGARLVQSGPGREDVRMGHGNQPGTEVRQELDQHDGTREVQRLRSRTLVGSGELDQRCIERMPILLTAHRPERSNTGFYERGRKPLQESRGPLLELLRRARDRVSIRFFGGSDRLGREGARAAEPGVLNRPGRQRRPLRTGQPTLGNTFAADEQPTSYTAQGVSPGTLAILGSNGAAETQGREDSGGDHRGCLARGEGEAQGLADDRAEVDVYDLVNSGPRHRFTVDGVLVHNCLALGYNGGVNSLRAMGAEGDNDTLQRLVNVWRRANPRIVKLWETMQDAVDGGGRVGPHIKITRRGDQMKMHLPSGRAISYHGMRWDRYTVTDDKTGRKIQKQGYRYNDPKRGGARIGTYGGRLVENATQAIARDVLAEALVRLDEAGHLVVGHVHDEVIAESTELDEITRLMTQVPRWARGLPLDGEGYVTERYRKG